MSAANANTSLGLGGGRCGVESESVFTVHGARACAAEFDKIGGRYVRVGGVGPEGGGADMVSRVNFLTPYSERLASVLDAIRRFVLFAVLFPFVVFLGGFAREEDVGGFLNAATLGQPMWFLFSVFRYAVESLSFVLDEEFLASVLSTYGVYRVSEAFAFVCVLRCFDIRDALPRFLQSLEAPNGLAFVSVLNSFRTLFAVLEVYCNIPGKVVLSLIAVFLSGLWTREMARQFNASAGVPGVYIALITRFVTSLVPLPVFTATFMDIMVLRLVTHLAGRTVVNSQPVMSEKISPFARMVQEAFRLPMDRVPEALLKSVMQPIVAGERSGSHPSRRWAMYGDKVIGTVLVHTGLFSNWDVATTSGVVTTIASNSFLAGFARSRLRGVLSEAQLNLSEGAVGTVVEAVFALSWHYNVDACGMAPFREFLLSGLPEARGSVLNRDTGLMDSGVGARSGMPDANRSKRTSL